MKLLQLFILFIVASLFTLSTVSAQSGKVIGQVTDEDNFNLAGANIIIEKTDKGTSTDQHGNFAFFNVPEGLYNVTVSYIGFEAVSKEVKVMPNKTTVVNFTLKSGVLVGEEVLVVGDALKGQAKALNQQKNNANITNIVSADQIGRFPDGNIGDALKRIPSITVAYDQGEARFANVRGTEPRLNSVTINGERIPSAEAEIRSIQLDLVPSDMVQTIEVNKAVTPDMDADAIGGSINLVTKSAPNKLRISATAASGFNYVSQKAPLIGSFTLGNRFFGGKLGVVLSGSYYDNELGSDNTEGEWDDEYTVDEWEVRSYDIRRLRQSLAANFDYKLAEGHTLFFKSIYNHRNDWENRFRVVYKKDDDDGEDIWKVERQTKGGIDSDENDNARLEDQRMWTGSFSGEHLFNQGIKVDWGVALSKASEERPNERYIEWVAEVPRAQITDDASDLSEPHFYGEVALEDFELNEITEEYQYTEETDFNTRLNITIPLVKSGQYKNELKFGGRYKTKEKKRDNNFYEYTPVNEPANITLYANNDYSDGGFLAGDYLIGTFTTPELLGKLDLTNSSLFEQENKPDEYAADNYSATENIIAGYAMLDQNVGDKLKFIAGIRVEMTDVEYEGNEFNEETEDITPTRGDADYVNVLPGLHAKYMLNKNTILRAAWTNTIARPNYYDLVPYRAIAEDNEELAIGNPSLEPTTSMNFDFMAESYFKSVGLVSAGVFYKQIEDFIYIDTESDYLDPVSGNIYDDFFQPKNGAEATLFGFEVAMQRRLDFLPSFLKNISIYANYTYTSSEADNPEFKEEAENDETIELPGTAPHTLNASVSYEDKLISLGVSFNYSAPYLDPDLDLTPNLERYYDTVTYLDLNGSFKFTDNARFFFEANNLLNQPLRYYAGDSDRTMQAEYYNVRVNAGVKFDL